MRVLLDTQVWLWMQASPGRFSEQALDLLRSSANELLLSAASSWEIAIKYSLGKLPLPAPPADYVPERMTRSATTALVVTHAHALEVSSLPPHHRDPFDRILVAQARIERLPIMTSDRKLADYEVELLWA